MKKAKRKYGTGSIRRQKGYRFWMLSYKVDGKRVNESSRTEDYEEAEAILVARLRQVGVMSSNVATLATEGLTSTIGAAAEMLVSADLLSRGIEVFRALNIHCSCDLIAHRHGRLVRIEVKTGSLDWRGRPQVGISKQRGKHDVLAVVDRKSGIHYYPPIEEVFGEAKPSTVLVMPG
jgi:hypothetical protein